MPLPDEVEAIKNISVTTTIHNLQSFIGLIKYHEDTQQYRFGILTPLSSITSIQAK